MVIGAAARDADGVPRKALHEKELVAMGTYPHDADPSQERSTRSSAPDPEPHIPRPLPKDERRTGRVAIAVLLAAIAIIALIVLL